jgi:hypothetical protein
MQNWTIKLKSDVSEPLIILFDVISYDLLFLHCSSDPRPLLLLEHFQYTLPLGLCTGWPLCLCPQLSANLSCYGLKVLSKTCWKLVAIVMGLRGEIFLRGLGFCPYEWINAVTEVGGLLIKRWVLTCPSVSYDGARRPLPEAGVMPLDSPASRTMS